MNKIQISRKHNMGHQECCELAEGLLDQLVGKYGGSIKNDGQCYHYRHSTGMKAMVEPREDELDITVKLNLITKSFAPRVEEQINKVLDEKLEQE